MYVCGRRYKVTKTKEIEINGTPFLKFACENDNCDTLTMYKPLDFATEHCILPDTYVWVVSRREGSPVLTAIE